MSANDMTIYGLDFTSSPSRKSASGKSAKWLTLAKCRLTETVLKVESLTKLNSDAANDFCEYENWLRSPGEWIAGIDFSFGMPVAAIEYYGWLSADTNGTWADYIRRLYDQIKDMREFEKVIEGWTYLNEVSESGNLIKIQPKRITDQLSHSQSPMKVNDNPHPGKMFFRGCKALLESNVIIPPLRCHANDQPYRVAIEAYPRLVARQFMPEKVPFREALDSLATLTKSLKETKLTSEEKKQAIVQSASLRPRLREMLRYKETKSDEAKANRKRIIKGLAGRNAYGVMLDVGEFADYCVQDPKGDVLDSVLCAIQAAWAYTQREKNYGIPRPKSEILKKTLALEGWIVDPSLQNFGAS